MRRCHFSEWGLIVILFVAMIFMATETAVAKSQKQHLKLKGNEIGVEDWQGRGYTLGSHIEVTPNAQSVVITQRMFNGSNLASTIDWHSAAFRYPSMKAGEFKEKRTKMDVSGVGGFLHWPVPYDCFDFGQHSATIETEMGTLNIDGAPAYMPRLRVWIAPLKSMIRGIFKIGSITTIKTAELDIKFQSEARSTGKTVEYVSKIQNNGEKMVHIQWLGFSTNKAPQGIIVNLPGGMREARTVFQKKSEVPIKMVSDVALINIGIEKQPPGMTFSFLGNSPDFESRLKELAKMKLGKSIIITAPVVIPVE